MLYLAAILLPLTFLYSPKVDKKGPVFLTRTMTITQERNTPAYTVFKLAQESSGVLHKADTVVRESLNDDFELLTPQTVQAQNNVILSAMVFDKASLKLETTAKLRSIAIEEQDSLLLAQLVHERQQSESAEATYNKTAALAAVIKGHFELTDGLAIIDHKVTLKRTLAGQTVEIGKVHLTEGSYEIEVGSFEGELTAEIKDPSGFIIGEDQQRIADLVREENYFKGPTLKLGRPLGFSMNTRTYDNNRITQIDQAKAYLFSKNYALKKTDDIYPNVARHSATIGFIESAIDGRWASTLSIRTTKDISQTILFNKSWFGAVTQYLADSLQIQFIPQSGYIVGRILQDGKPVAGAQVVVENQIGLEPYYFSSLLIPDFKQVSTADNGLFIIPGLHAGSYQVTAFLGQRNLGSQLYFVEPEILSYQEIHSSVKTRVQTARSFDAFTGEIARTDLQIPGVSDIVSVQDAVQRFKVYHTVGLTEVFNRPQSAIYIPYVYMQNSAKNYLQLPQIEDRFVEYLKENTHIITEPGTSLFMGFVQYDQYEVYLAQPNSLSRIVYFDSLGKISETPVPYGGFAIFNVPTGSQEVVVENKSQNRTAAQVFYSVENKNIVAHFEE